MAKDDDHGDGDGLPLSVLSTLMTTTDVTEARRKYNEMITQNKSCWTYQVPPPPDGYWKSIKHDEAYTFASMYFLEQIERQTRAMRYGESEAIVTIISDDLRHDESLLPYWNEFCKALSDGYQYTLNVQGARSHFYLRGMELPNQVLDVLFKGLSTVHFKCLGFENNNFGSDGMKHILGYVQNNTILEELYQCQNTINKHDMHQLCEVIESHPSMNTLKVIDCNRGKSNGYEMLRSVITAGTTKLKELDLSRNGISTCGSTFISDFLTTNPMLQNLILQGNQLNDKDATLIAKSLKHNTNLRYLDITNNLVTEAGWDELNKAEFDSTSLNSAANSNHTCKVKQPTTNAIVSGEANGNYLNPKAIRSKKVYSILSTRNREGCNVKYFDDISLKLLPNMLESIREHSRYSYLPQSPRRDRNDVNPLSVIFEVSKWDEAMSVYESMSK